MYLVNIIKVFVGVTSLSHRLPSPKSVLKTGVSCLTCFVESLCRPQLRLVGALFAEAGGGVVE